MALALTANAQLVVVPDSNVIPLVNNFILTGVTASNVQFTGGTLSIGSFSNGATTNLGLNDGIVMSTGTLFMPPYIGSPASNFSSNSLSLAGDSLLTGLAGITTNDANILEFDLVPVGNILEFNYIFASEEYPEFVFSSFNDVFGFFISGPNPAGGNYANENIAIIPGGSLPVAIDNVNATLNSTYYIDNTSGSTIIFDGFTTPLLAQLSVTPGLTYHLKMAIADAGDGVFDSGIFLKAQSMKSYIITGVGDQEATQASVYPNPISENSEVNFNVSAPGTVNISIQNLSGQTIMQMEQSYDQCGLQHFAVGQYLSNQPNGMYFLRIVSNSDTQIVRLQK